MELIAAVVELVKAVTGSATREEMPMPRARPPAAKETRQ
jgi:hypothetical protein